MTLEEIKTKLRLMERDIELLRAESERLENAVISDFISCELSYISYRISELAEVEEDSEGNPDTDGLENELQEWWDDISNDDKASIVGIPAPSRNDARGDEQCAFDDYCNKWWTAKTIAQRQEIYERENDMYNMYEECHQP